MSAQHTPGPWSAYVLDKRLGDIPAYVEKCIAASQGTDFFFVSAEMPDGAVDVCHVGNGPRGLTNARLIAAAPDMLAALIVAREFISTDRTALADCAMDHEGRMSEDDAAAVADYDKALLQIDAAIQKATGGAA